MKALYIASWGDPGGWETTKYRTLRIPEKPTCRPSELSENYVDKPISSWSSFDAVVAGVNYLSGSYIFVNDTLAFSKKIRCGKDDCIYPKECDISNLHDSEPWDWLSECARKYVTGVIEARHLITENPEILVVPGSGHFKGNGLLSARFVSHPWNLEASLYIEILKKLRNVKDDLLLLVDVTHGMNYLPLMMLMAAEKAASLWVLEMGKKAWLLAVQSDPVLKENLNEEHLINPVYCRIINMEEAIAEVLSSASRLSASDPNNQRPYNLRNNHLESIKKNGIHDKLEKLKRAYKVLTNISISIVNALKGGLILPMIYAISELQKCCDIGSSIAEAINELRSYAENALESLPRFTLHSTSDKGEHVFVRPITVNPLLIDVHMVTGLLSKVAEILDTFSPDEGVGLKVIEDVGSELIPHGMGKYLLTQEISNYRERTDIYRSLCGKRQGWIPYSAAYKVSEYHVDEENRIIDLYRKMRKNGESYHKLKDSFGNPKLCDYSLWGCDLDERIFYAHAGMSSEAVEFRYADGDISIRYREDCIEKVLKLLRKA